MRLSAAISGRFVRFLCIGLGKPKTEGPAVKLALGVEMSLLPALSAGGGGAGSTHSFFGTHRDHVSIELGQGEAIEDGLRCRPQVIALDTTLNTGQHGLSY